MYQTRIVSGNSAIGLASVYKTLPIGYWNCSDCVVFFLLTFYYQHYKKILFLNLKLLINGPVLFL